MDINPVAPFNMYSDENILWIEKNKNIHWKTIAKSLKLVFGLETAASTILIVLALIFKGEYVLLTAGAAIGACAFFSISLISGLMYLKQKNTPAITYYITNFRIVELHEGKKTFVKYGYLINLKDFHIHIYSDKTTSIDFEWKNDTNAHNSIYSMNDINNAQKIYDLIKKQLDILKNRSCSYDSFIVQ